MLQSVLFYEGSHLLFHEIIGNMTNQSGIPSFLESSFSDVPFHIWSNCSTTCHIHRNTFKQLQTT